MFHSTICGSMQQDVSVQYVAVCQPFRITSIGTSSPNSAQCSFTFPYLLSVSCCDGERREATC
jgi:hypothetical protein